jgi:hypothetical protein
MGAHQRNLNQTNWAVSLVTMSLLVDLELQDKIIPFKKYIYVKG